MSCWPLLLAATLAGWDDGVLEGPAPAGAFELRLNLGGERWDNLIQSHESRNPPPVTGARSEARFTWRLSPNVPLKSYVELGQLRYDARAATTAYGAGLGLESDRHSVNLGARVEGNRPSMDIGDGADVLHDALTLRLRYALKTKAFESWVSGDRAEQRFETVPLRNGHWHIVQAGAAYFGLSRKVAPELTLGWAGHDAGGDSELDLRQRRVQLGLRMTPMRSVSVAARLDYTARTFGIRNPAGRNFGRRDKRWYGTLQALLKLSRHASWTVVYDRLQGRSSRANRGFDAGYFATSLTLRLGSTSTVPPPVPPRGPARPQAANVVATPAGPAALVPEAPAKTEPDFPAAAVAAAPAPRSLPLPSQAAGGVRAIEAMERLGEIQATIHGDGLAQYSTLMLSGPSRLVVDLVGVSARAPFAVPFDTELVSGIRVAPYRPGPTPVARVVFDLHVPALAEVERVGDTIRVFLRAAPPAASMAGATR